MNVVISIVKFKKFKVFACLPRSYGHPTVEVLYTWQAGCCGTDITPTTARDVRLTGQFLFKVFTVFVQMVLNFNINKEISLIIKENIIVLGYRLMGKSHDSNYINQVPDTSGTSNPLSPQ